MFLLVVGIYLGVFLAAIYLCIEYKINLFRLFLLSLSPIILVSLFFMVAPTLRGDLNFIAFIEYFLFFITFGYAIFFPFLVVPALIVLILFTQLSLLKRAFYSFWLGVFFMELFYLIFGWIEKGSRWYILLAGISGSLAVVIDYFLYNMPKKKRIEDDS